MSVIFSQPAVTDDCTGRAARQRYDGWTAKYRKKLWTLIRRMSLMVSNAADWLSDWKTDQLNASVTTSLVTAAAAARRVR